MPRLRSAQRRPKRRRISPQVPCAPRQSVPCLENLTPCAVLPIPRRLRSFNTRRVSPGNPSTQGESGGCPMAITHDVRGLVASKRCLQHRSRSPRPRSFYQHLPVLEFLCGAKWGAIAVFVIDQYMQSHKDVGMVCRRPSRTVGVHRTHGHACRYRKRSMWVRGRT
jgi:hypothetical protein